MSYLVIARKWRPNLFSEIVGQEHVTRTLANAVSSGRTSHAYIFSGPRGVGKTTAARILAKCVNCASGPTATPCNSCEICSSITAGSAVDVMEIDGASNTSVDNIRELKENVRFVPSVCRYKVYIIDEVHMLSTAAFNALLKTLEEPPPHALFIFATTEVHKIPRTILSRCQRFDFKRIPFREILGHLAHIADKEGIKVAPGVLEIISREADGSMRDAESLLDQVIAYGGTEITEGHVLESLGLMDRSLILDLTEAVLSGDAGACIGAVEKAHTFGYDLKKVCIEVIERVRDMSVLKATGDTGLLELPDTELKRLGKAAEGVGQGRLDLLFSILSAGYDDVARSLTPRFALEMTLLRAARAGELRPISELVDSLEAVVRQGGAGGGSGAGSSGRSADERPVKPAPAGQKLPWKKPVEAVEERPGPEEAEPNGEARTASEPTTAWQGGKGESAGKTTTRADADVSGFMEFVSGEKKQRLIASALRNAGAVLIEGELRVNPGGPATMLFDHRAEVEKFCLEFFSKEIKLVAAGAGTKDAAQEEHKAVNSANAGNGVKSDTVVKEAIRILGGRVVEDSRRTDV
jgi:DNA polymerase-3 subunit gamma/tau